MQLGGAATGTQVTNYRSYDLANTMARGAALVWDNCCQGITGQFGNPEKQFEGWNANGIEFTNPNADTLMQYNNAAAGAPPRPVRGGPGRGRHGPGGGNHAPRGPS